MMAFFNGKKKSRMLMVAILVMTLVATYAIPMTVFATDSGGGSGDGSEFVDGTGDGDFGGDEGGLGGDGSGDGDLGDDEGDLGGDGLGDGDLGDDDDDLGGDDDDDLGGEDSGDKTTDGGIKDSTDEEMSLKRTFESIFAAPSIPNTGDGIAPVVIAQNGDDDPADLDQYSSFKVGKQDDGTYSNGDGFSVDLDYNTDDDKVGWSSNTPVKYVIVKGQGKDHLNLYSYNNDSGDTGLMAPLHQDDFSKINHITFYYEAPYEIFLEKTASVAEAVRGDEITYTFVVTNTGTKELKNVKLHDNKINKQWTIGTLASGDQYTTTAAFTIPDNGYGSYDLVNTATATGQYEAPKGKGWETKTISIKDTATVSVKAKYGISLEKTASVSEAVMGDQIIYTFTVTNTGTDELKNVVLSDPLLNKTWSIGTLAGGEEYTTIAAFTVPDAFNLSYDLKNIAVVSAEYKYWKPVNFGPYKPGYWDTKTIYDTDKATVKINSLPKYAIQLEKTASVETALPGDKVTYTFTVTNTGYLPFGKVVLTDSKIGYSDSKTLHLKYGEQTTFTKEYELPDDAIFPYVNNATVKGQVWEGIFGFGAWKTKDTAEGSFTIEEKSQDPPQDTYNYTVYYKVIESLQLLHTVTGTASELPVTVLEPDVVKNNSDYRFYSNTLGSTADVTFSLVEDQTSYTATVWYEPIGEESEAINYTVNYLATSSGITVAGIESGSTTQSSVTITLPAITGYQLSSVQPQYPIYGVEGETIGYQTQILNGVLTITLSQEIDGETVYYEYTNFEVWYTEVSGSDIVRSGRGSGGTTILPEPVPAAPIETLDDPILLDEAVPAGPLPKTGGIPSLLLYGLGALLAGGGATLKLKKNK